LILLVGSGFRRAAGYGRRVHEGELLRVSNRHAAALPAVEERPGRYLGYFENRFGEQFVFVHEDGELDARVFCGDVDWQPRRVTDASGLPDVGDLSSTRKSVRFCSRAGARRRGDARPLSPPAERRRRQDRLPGGSQALCAADPAVIGAL
jgi:hypothetical protein